MTVTMGPPLTRNPTAAADTSTSQSSSSATILPPPPRNPSSSASELPTSESSTSITMGPPPPKTPTPSAQEQSKDGLSSQIDACPLPLSSPNQSVPEPSKAHNELSPPETVASEIIVEKKEDKRNDNAGVVPYTIPEWSGTPCHHFFFEVLKHGAIIDQIDVNKKGAYMFGRVDLCDFVLEHPTISRFHAVLQFKRRGDAFIFDLGSTHGTFVNKKEVKKKVYMDLHVGDVIRFGHSSRLYLFQGPSDLMPSEGDLKKIRNAKLRQETKDMEASLLRAKLEASRADGISWGMDEDAVEENEDEVDDITWQTYKGQLTEKQEKTRDKVIKRLEKIAHMKKEIDAIRAKDIAQGGLTQGQQTQIARNEQRISQLMEELENLEETLNESIRESLGARGGRVSSGKKEGAMYDEEENYSSDDDEFYDRTQKSTKQKSGENQAVETSDTLLDKRDALIKEIKDKEKLFLDADKPIETNEVVEAGDELDAYMSTVSSQLVVDKKEKIRKEISIIQSELDRILYLLKIADPTGEAAKKRELEGTKPKEHVRKTSGSDSSNHSSTKTNRKSAPAAEKNNKIVPSSEKSENPLDTTPILEKAIHETTESRKKPEEPELVTATVYTVAKPQWLGAIEEIKKQEIAQEAPSDMQETDQFVDYKDRGTILKRTHPSEGDSGIEEAAPGLIIRKRKQVEPSKLSEVKDTEQSVGSEFKAEDAVALLLKHSRGYLASDVEERPISEDMVVVKNQKKKAKKKAKRVLDPEKPTFVDDELDSTTWVPPEGQSGDGRTSLNDRFGY